jgi:LuxR family maltose regulon positive regulatory protein
MCAVVVEKQLLRTKLHPPRLPDIVVRERLLEELNKARSTKLTSIVAGAGYGKTILASQYLQRLGYPSVYYQLDAADSDLSVFLRYMIAGLRESHPGFGKGTIKRLATADNIAEQCRSVLSTFIAELDTIAADELFLALDDFHNLDKDAPVVEAMNFLLNHSAWRNP